MREDALRYFESKFREDFPSLLVENTGSELKVGPTQDPSAVIITAGEQDWRVLTAEWHGHFEDLNEAVETALFVLCGLARTANEYRGNELSGTWLEVYDGEAYELTHLALFLNPFDQDEWQLWPEESWRVHRVHRRYIDLPPFMEDGDLLDNVAPRLGERNEFDLESGEPVAPAKKWCLERWDKELGAPVDGFRWTNDYHFKLVLPAPVGWRRTLDNESEWKSANFSPAVGHPILRVFTAFRDAESPATSERLKKPSSIDYQHEPVATQAPEWARNQWEIVFQGTDQDMLARIELYAWRGAGSDDPDWFRRIDPLIQSCRYME